jgi:ubiquinone/menaquinone biosynthesis C-methylase UbiE
MIGPRRNIPELMDDPTIADERIDRALKELSVINRWLGGYRVSRLGVGQFIGNVPADRPVTVLDVGAGGSHLSRALAPLGREFHVTSVDVNLRACDYAKGRRHAANVVNGSAHALPFREHSVDIAHASLFLHHCTDEEAQVLLADLSRIARYGLVINDLHRHPIAYAGIFLLTRLLSRSAFVRHDAPVSVLRGFLRREFAPLLPSGLQQAVLISWHWAFRWCVCISLT